MNYFTKWFIYIVPLILWGCSFHTSINLKNNTNHTIQVYSNHTGKVTKIEAYKSRNIEHTMGSLAITLEDGTVWEYTNITVPDISDDYIKYKKRNFISPAATVYLLLDSDGLIYIQRVNGNKNQSDIKYQPDGFPLVPEQVRSEASE